MHARLCVFETVSLCSYGAQVGLETTFQIWVRCRTVVNSTWEVKAADGEMGNGGEMEPGIQLQLRREFAAILSQTATTKPQINKREEEQRRG